MVRQLLLASNSVFGPTATITRLEYRGSQSTVEDLRLLAPHFARAFICFNELYTAGVA